MTSYAGQVSLPGGKADHIDEKPFETARREASEEIGLPREAKNLPAPFQVEQLCELPVHLALTELGVRPCVAFLHSGEASDKSSSVEETLIPRLNSSEVDTIFSAPFERFLSNSLGSEATPKIGTGSRDNTTKAWYTGTWRHWNDNSWRMHDFNLPRSLGGAAYKGRPSAGPGGKNEFFRIWGLTATIVVNAARLAYGREPEFAYSVRIGEEEDIIAKMLETGRLSEERKPGSKITREDLRKVGQKERI